MITILAAALLAAAPMQQADTTFAVDPGSTLEVENLSGRVVVHTWNEARIRLRARGEGSGHIGVARVGSTIRLEPDSRRWGERDIDYDLMIPSSMGVRVSGTDTDVDISGAGADVRIQTVQGDIRVQGGQGVISLRSVQGGVTLTGARGNVDAHSVSDDVRLSDVVGDIRAETVSGDIILDGVESSSVRASTVSGDVDFRGSIARDGQYSFTSHGGDLTLRLPDRVDATVGVSTFNGDFDTEFPVQLTGTRQHGRRFTFTLGSGSARIDLESFSGDIELKRGASER